MQANNAAPWLIFWDNSIIKWMTTVGLYQNFDWAVRPGRLNKADLSLAQGHFNTLYTFQTRFTNQITELINGLPLDEEGEPILPVNGKPGYRWREEEKKVILDVIWTSLDNRSLALYQCGGLKDPARSNLWLPTRNSLGNNTTQGDPS